MNDQERDLCFRELVNEFEDRVPPILQEVEFEKSEFGAHYYGKNGRNYQYTFVSVSDEQTLDLLRFELWRDHLSVRVFYNRFHFSHHLDGLSDFEGKLGLELLTMPLRQSEIELHRWLPVPFLKIPKLYRVRSDSVRRKMKQEVQKVIKKLTDDLRYIEITRAEWKASPKPILLSVEGMD